LADNALTVDRRPRARVVRLARLFQSVDELVHKTIFSDVFVET